MNMYRILSSGLNNWAVREQHYYHLVLFLLKYFTKMTAMTQILWNKRHLCSFDLWLCPSELFSILFLLRHGYPVEVPIHSSHRAHGYDGQPAYSNQYGSSYGEARRSAKRRLLPATPTGTINNPCYSVSLCKYLPFQLILPLSIAVRGEC